MKLMLALPLMTSLVFSWSPGTPGKGFTPGLGPYYPKNEDDLAAPLNLNLNKYGLGLGPAVYENVESQSKKTKSGSIWNNWGLDMGIGPVVNEYGNLLENRETTNEVKPIKTELGATERLMKSAGGSNGLVCGGYTSERKPDENEIEVYKTVQEKNNWLPNLKDFSNVLVKTQVVAGVNYTYNIPDGEYEVEIYKPLPSSNDPTPQLISVKKNGSTIYPLILKN